MTEKFTVSQGTSVALSSDGSTALVGDPDDSLAIGATWVFTRSGGVWTTQGAKLVGAGLGGFQTFLICPACDALGLKQSLCPMN